jgi:hypothetical protein
MLIETAVQIVNMGIAEVVTIAGTATAIIKTAFEMITEMAMVEIMATVIIFTITAPKMVIQIIEAIHGALFVMTTEAEVVDTSMKITMVAHTTITKCSVA